MKRPDVKKLQAICDKWNAVNPVGTTVEYHPVIDEPAHRIRTTRTAAQALSGHTAVVWLNGESGCVCLEACVVIDNPANVERSQTDDSTPPKEAKI